MRLIKIIPILTLLLTNNNNSNSNSNGGSSILVSAFSPPNNSINNQLLVTKVANSLQLQSSTKLPHASVTLPPRDDNAASSASNDHDHDRINIRTAGLMMGLLGVTTAQLFSSVVSFFVWFLIVLILDNIDIYIRSCTADVHDNCYLIVHSLMSNLFHPMHGIYILYIIYRH